VLTSLESESKKLGIPYLLVGAAARDLLLHLAYGLEVQRATVDLDFGFMVSSWEQFQELKSSLSKAGFKETRSIHRVISPEDMIVDIIPFGGVEEENGCINWPPKQEIRMNVLGFQEAYKSAEKIIIANNPDVEITVASAPGLTLLKMIAWSDRSADIRQKDAKDLKYIFDNYEHLPGIRDEAFNKNIVEKYDWEITYGTIHLLGMHVHDIASDETIHHINGIKDERHKGLSIEKLSYEMGWNTSYVEAFFNGFNTVK
jgi:predicted nucleotidyltransferase